MTRYTNCIITNRDTKKLKNCLTDLISKSKELKFLVGFFYFSDIRELYNALNPTCAQCAAPALGGHASHNIFLKTYYAQVGLMFKVSD